MAAECLVEVYRTNENKSQYQFTAVVTITYFGDEATLQGMSGSYSQRCHTELMSHLASRGVTKIRYFRRGKLVIRKIRYQRTIACG